MRAEISEFSRFALTIAFGTAIAALIRLQESWRISQTGVLPQNAMPSF